MTPKLLAMTVVLLLLVSSIVWADQPDPLDTPSVDVDAHETVLTASGDDEEVRIVRTAEGTPHVYADSPFALGFGNGYVQAEDQLFQLHVLRLVAKGESASVLGPGFLEGDLSVRRELYTHEEREEAVRSLPGFERALFEGYAAGVNRVITEFAMDPSRVPVEFGAVADLPEPWAVTDTIAVAQFLLDQFGSSGGAELSNARLLGQLRERLGDEEGLEAFEDVVWLEHPLAATSIPDSEGEYEYPEMTTGWDEIPQEQREATLAAVNAVPFGQGESLVQNDLPFRFGSNAVIVSPEVSRSGGGLLGGGPQMGYFSPQVPYEVGLHGAGFDVAGIGVSGAPGVVIGRTASFSWTVTSGIGDQVDVVGVRLAQDDPRSYHYGGEVLEMDCRTETHIVRAPPPTGEDSLLDSLEDDVVLQEVCRTRHGPVFAMNTEAGWAFARERSHRHEEIASGLHWLSLGRAQDFEGFLETFDDFAFTFNFHYVDDEHMAYVHTGFQPVRDQRLDPRFPRPGTGDYGWTGMLKGDDLPRTVDPEQGWIVNWNNQPQKGWRGSGDQRELFGSVHRVDLLRERFETALEESDDAKVDLETVARVVREAGTRDPFARHIAPFAIDTASRSNTQILVDMGQALEEWAATDYSWDTENDTHSPGQTVYERFRTHLQELVFRDEMGNETREMGWDPPSSDDPHGGDYVQHRNKDALLVDALEGRTVHDWCDNVTLPIERSCDWQIESALIEAALDLLGEFQSGDVDEWRMPTRMIRFVSISASPAWEIPLQNRATFNHLHDWGTEGNREAMSVLPPGQEAGYWNLERFLRMTVFDEFPEHARDQLDLYLDWEYKPFRFFEDQVEEDAGREYVLVPGAV